MRQLSCLTCSLCQSTENRHLPAIFSLVEDRLYEVVEKNDSLIVFFAGHGQTRVREVGDRKIETGYLVPVDATQSWGDYVEIDPFLRSLSALPARHILVILDSCHSGFALGQAIQSFRDTVRYEKDLSSRISRKVITSAQQDQLALDGGPVPGHSLFTGTLIDGFNWGKADLDGNGLISSSELGLFIQQQVAQASASKQTPDFGSFHLDNRGEMVISLRNQSFDALKARAFSTLQNGEFISFKEIVEQIILLKPSSPEALYLKYRLMLIENNIDQAIEAITELEASYPQEGVIPISHNDLWVLSVQLPCWKPVLKIPETDLLFEVLLLNGQKEKPLQPIQPQKHGDRNIFLIKYETLIKFKITNSTQETIHVYMTEIDSRGRFSSIPLWDDEEIMWNGLKPGIAEFSYPFTVIGDPGVCEFRLFSSSKRVKELLNPPAPNARNLRPMEFAEADLQNIKMKSFYYRSIRPSMFSSD